MLLSLCVIVWLIVSTQFVLLFVADLHRGFSAAIFTARAYARVVLGVVILSVCLSVTRVHCDKIT